MLSQSDDDLAILFRRKGLAAKEVAAALGVHKTSLSQWVNGKVSLPAPRAIELASLLGITEEEIWRAYAAGKERYRQKRADS